MNALRASIREVIRLLFALVTFISIVHGGLAVAANDDQLDALSCSHQPQDVDKLRRALELERSKNGLVSDALVESGDALSEARPIQHWAYFSTKEGRAQFIALIEQQFSGIDPHTNPMSPGKEHAVTFWHTGIPDSDSMTKVTAMLSLAAESCGGEYDGWETQVVR